AGPGRADAGQGPSSPLRQGRQRDGAERAEDPRRAESRSGAEGRYRRLLSFRSGEDDQSDAPEPDVKQDRRLGRRVKRKNKFRKVQRKARGGVILPRAFWFLEDYIIVAITFLIMKHLTTGCFRRIHPKQS